MKFQKRFYLVLAMLLLSTALFAACGDPTATPVPPATATKAATTAAAAAPTTAAPTTAAATTVAPTTAPATTVAPTTAPATTVAATTAAAAGSIPVPSSWKEVALDADVVKALASSIPPGLKVDFKFYGSADDGATAATAGDTSFTGAGYKFGIPGQTKPTDSGGTIGGLYSKTGVADVLFTVQDAASSIASLETALKTGGASQASIDKTTAAAKSYKSLITVIYGNGLLQSFLSAGAPTTAAATTAAATTAAATTAAASGSGDTLGIYPGGTAVTLPASVISQFEASVGASVVNPQVAAFTTPDSADKVKAYYVDLLTKGGWKDLAATAGAGLAQLDSVGGTGIIYNKDKQIVVLIGLPSAVASGLGITGAPATGTLVIGFYGEAK